MRLRFFDRYAQYDACDVASAQTLASRLLSLLETKHGDWEIEIVTENDKSIVFIAFACVSCLLAFLMCWLSTLPRR